VRFDSFNDIAMLYRANFGQEFDDIFSKAKDVGIIEAIRNVFAHRAGVADKAFLERFRRHSDFQNLAEGDHVKLKVSRLLKYIDSVASFSVLLTESVDKQVQRYARPAKE
jgi:hypothetical protein